MEFIDLQRVLDKKNSWRPVTVSGAINLYFVSHLEHVYPEIKQIKLPAYIFMASKLNCNCLIHH